MAKRGRVAVTVLFFLTLCAAHSEAGVLFVGDVRPAASLYSPNLSDMKVKKNGGPLQGTLVEEIHDEWSYLPSIRFGLGFGSGPLALDLKLGAGMLYNKALDTSYSLSEVEARWTAWSSGVVGAHAGLLHFRPPRYSGKASMDISSANGVSAGLSLSSPGLASFTASIDYLKASFDVSAGQGWTVSEDSLDLSGWLFQLGVMGRF